MNNDEANKKERNYPCRRGYNILNEQILLIFSQEHENYFRSEIPKRCVNNLKCVSDWFDIALKTTT